MNIGMRNRSGIAAIEFALIAPLMITMAIGVFDVSRAMIIYQQVIDTAHNVANAASVSASINADNSTTLSDAEANSSMSIVWADMPWLESGILKGARGIILTSVAFRPIAGCPGNGIPNGSPNCYDAKVAFSIPYHGKGTGWDTQTRACGRLKQYQGDPPPGQTYQTSLTMLATGNVGSPDALMVADVHYTFSPSSPFSLLLGAIDFQATASVTPRSGSTTASPSGAGQYTTYSGAQGTGNCTSI